MILARSADLPAELSSIYGVAAGVKDPVPDNGLKKEFMSAVPANNQAADTEPAPPARSGLKKGWDNFRAQVKRRGHIFKNFVKELFNDHGFWVEALAVKGGASAILVAGIVTASYVVALPFLAAATGIAVCTGLVALGVYGISAGSTKAWESLKGIYARATGKAPQEHVYTERKDLLQRLGDSKFVAKIRQHPLSQKIRGSRAWQLTQRFSQKREDSILGGIAVGGAALTLTLGAVALVSQLLVLPVVAIGTLATFATVTAATSIASGCSGLYFSITGIRDRAAQRKQLLAAQAQAAAQLAITPATTPAPSPGTILLPGEDLAGKDLSESFEQAVATPAAAPVNDNRDAAAPKQAPKQAGTKRARPE